MPLEFIMDDVARRFRAELDGVRVGYIDFDPVSPASLLIKHTEVPAAFEGRGYGGALVRALLEEARRQGKTVIPVCTFASGFIKRHPEYLELVLPSYRAALR